MAIAGRCDTCAFWDTNGATAQDEPMKGKCRKRPPMRAIDGTVYAEMWPVTSRDDWCGAVKPTNYVVGGDDG